MANSRIEIRKGPPRGNHIATCGLLGQFSGKRTGTRYFYTFSDAAKHHSQPYFRWRNETIEAISKTPPCIFCGEPSGLDAITDDHGEIACSKCGTAEARAQSEDARKKGSTHDR